MFWLCLLLAHKKLHFSSLIVVWWQSQQTGVGKDRTRKSKQLYGFSRFGTSIILLQLVAALAAMLSQVTRPLSLKPVITGVLLEHSLPEERAFQFSHRKQRSN